MPHRLVGFDVVKGAAILLVIFGHVWRGLNTVGLIPNAALFARIDSAIYLFHMPVFFFLAGLFFSARLRFPAFLTSRLALLIWPMVLWCWIDAGLKVALGVPFDGQMLTWPQVVLAPFPPGGVYWFLYTLFLLQILAWIIAQLPPSARMLVMAALAVAASLGRIDVSPFNSLWPTVIYLPEFFTGIIIGILARKETLLHPWLALPGIALFAIGQALVYLGWTAGSDLWSFAAVATATLGFILAVANLPMPAALRTGLAALGQLTMPIYLTHVIFGAAARIALLRLGVDGVGLHLLMGNLVGVIGPLALVMLAQRGGFAEWIGFVPPKGLSFLARRKH